MIPEAQCTHSELFYILNSFQAWKQMELVVTVCHFPHSTIYFIDCIVHTSRTSQTENSSPLIKTFVVVVFKIFPVGMGSRMKNNPWLSGFGGVLFWLGFFVFSFKCLGKNVFQENHSLFFSHLKMTMSFFSFLSIDSCKIITVFFSSTIQNSFLPVQTLNFFNIKFRFEGYFLLENFQQ